MLCRITNESGIYKVIHGYENRPVAWVSWYGTDAFCRFYGLHLPTEAQWEFAARGGNQMPSRRDGIWEYSGSNSIDSVAWYYRNSGSRTHAVCTKAPNRLGIYDLTGNLWEWCADWYVGRKYYQSATNPFFNEKGSDRVLRGGSWYGYVQNCRSARRNSDTPVSRDGYIGFSLVRD